jgi:hypothetical protein
VVNNLPLRTAPQHRVGRVRLKGEGLLPPSNLLLCKGEELPAPSNLIPVRGRNGAILSLRKGRGQRITAFVDKKTFARVL